MNTMKKIALLTALFFLLTGTAFAADQTIAATEEMVGSGHATKSDTLNRLTLVEHNTDGTHKSTITGLSVTAGKTITATENTSLDEAVAMSSKAPKASPTFTGLVTTAGQIAFPAVANPSADANTLDDYEEGAWTPAIAFDGSSPNVTYDAQDGRYTKTGNRVAISGRMYLTNKGTSAGGTLVTITGLPFTVKNSGGALSPPSLRLKTVSFANQHQACININATTIDLYEVTEAGTETQLDHNNFANTSQIFISGSYEAE